MVEAGTEFSLRKGAIRNYLLISSAVVIAFFMVYILILRYGVSQMGGSVELDWMSLLVPSLAIVAVLPCYLYPSRYIVTDTGVRVDHLLRTRTVEFEDIESVVIGHVRNDERFAEYVALTSNGSRTVLLGVVKNFDQLRDHIIESVDQAIVDDKRASSGAEKC
ncbi:MAG: hypothetical protein IH944_14450 [Armatimonadetes bacterium]|nr:hypothetical protein [Armatimonadota bacterium]